MRPSGATLIKKSVLELGERSVRRARDADLDLASEVCAAARSVNAGQSCIAANASSS
jgi:succinate-semialdehyde dehydrogenase/glutarate-semialdehyde dehydrogenase